MVDYQLKNMIRTAIIIILSTVWQVCFGQEYFDYKNDFKRLLRESKDSASENYYPRLLDRFQNDSSMTQEDVWALQVGYTANPYYTPYNWASKEREIQNLINAGKYEDAIKATNELLTVYPMNFTALMEKGFAYMKLEKDSTEFHKDQFMKILQATMKSGDGSKENPYFVLSPIDGQTLITHIFGESIGIMGSASDDNGYFLDMLEMTKEGGESKTLFFNINHAMENSEIQREIRKSIEKNKN